jgi:ribonuclease/clavin/mitogillin
VSAGHLTQPIRTGTNTYLVGRGRNRILIDTGEGKPTWATRLESILSQEKATVHQALITHWHGDHVNGIPDLLRLCPHATIHKNDPAGGQAGIADGQVFKVDGATLTSFHTPGHALDHMAFVLEEEDAIFTGDSRSSSALLRAAGSF